MGKKNGVAAKLKSSLDHIIAVHCIAHHLELGVSKSLQDHPRLKRLNGVLVFMYEQYHYFPKALRELRMLGEALEEKVMKPTNLKGSRWVPYIFKATQVHIVLLVSREICIHVACNVSINIISTNIKQFAIVCFRFCAPALQCSLPPWRIRFTDLVAGLFLWREINRNSSFLPKHGCRRRRRTGVAPGRTLKRRPGVSQNVLPPRPGKQVRLANCKG